METQTRVSDEQITATMEDKFGLSGFRPGQQEILTSVLERADTMGVMPTGGGKSLCYQLPAFLQKGIVVVVSPLIALMKDQVDQLLARGLPAGCLHSGQKFEQKKQVFQTMRQSDHFLLYVSPERVQREGFAQWAKTAPLSLMAIDEAHCVSQWGPDFRPDYYRLSLLRELRPDVPLLALTATATPMVLRDIGRQLGMVEPRAHVYGYYRPNLFYQVEPCESDSDKDHILEAALHQFPEGRILIYCGTRKQTEALNESLGQRFSGVGHYHAGLSSEERETIQQDYAARKLRILCATNAFGMGMDYADVRLVVHYQMPSNIESLYQEMGRAGRDGLESTCLLLYSKKDKGLHSFFIRQSDSDSATSRRRWRALDNLVQFAEGGECRHREVLTYFRDSQRIAECGHCDSCAPNSSRRVTYGALPFVKTSRRKKVVDATPLTGDQKILAKRIREWRKTYADAQDVPAFIVFSDKTLHDLARKVPQDLPSLENVYGLGPKKVESLGKELLELLLASS